MAISILFSGLLTGLLLGVFGSGGSIITMPSLLYLLDIEAKSAIAMSLGIVAITATITAIQHGLRGRVDIKITLVFGFFGMLGTYIGALVGVITPVFIQLSVFAIVMYLAAWKMLKPEKPTPSEHKSLGAAAVNSLSGSMTPLNYQAIAIHGIAVGVLTGAVGVGGGFLIVPALVLLSGLEIKKAVGSSLGIVALKSVAGFAGYAGQVHIDYSLMAQFTIIAIIASSLASRFTHALPAQQLKKGFAIFLLFVASYILLSNVYSF